DFGLTELQLYAYRDDQPNDGNFAIVSFDRDGLIEAGLDWTAKAPPPAGTVQVQQAPASQQVLDTLELIPDRTGFLFTGLPEMPELHPLGLYKLSADNKSIVSLKTGTVYPNAQYPETNVVTAINRKGETLEYPYYEDAEGKRYFLSAHLWYLQKDYATAQTEKIAKTDALGAARLLYRFAQAYEGYVPSTDYIWRNYPINITSGPPFNYWGGMWYRWSVADLNSLRPLLRAYNLVKKTNALELLSQEVGENVDKKLVEQMFIPSMQYALSYPYVLGNMNYTQWLGMIDAGKMLNEPDYIHNAFEWMQDYVETQFLSDGYWKEVAPSYHVQSTSGLDQAIGALEGYSDPVGYVSPRTGRRFDDLDMAKDYPIIERSIRDNNLLVYPDGKMLPLQDSWASDKAKSPIQNAGSFLMPAAGIGRLAAGAGAGQSQLWLQFQPKYGHNHYDPLQLNLYAQGQELLPDLGYTYTKDRSFSLSTMGHNTVVVDSKDMKIDNVSKHGGKIELFAPAGQVQVMRADQKEAYSGLDQYSREPWFVSFPGAQGGEGYVVDLFRISGGSRHEYTLQGDANRDSAFVTDMTTEPYGPYLLPPGTPVVEPEQFNDKGSAGGHYYGYISVKDVKKAQLPSDRYDLTLVTSENGTEKAKMKITGLLEPGSNELYLGRSPSIRSTRLSGSKMDTNDEAVKYNMPKLVLRRDGSSLKSTFITAMEPYRTAGPRIETIDRLQLSSGPEGAVAVKVTYGNTTDILISSPGAPNIPVIVDDITMRGKTGFIRMVNGVVQSMHLTGGTQLSKGSQTLTGSGTVGGAITATKRKVNGDPYDGIVVNTPIDPAQAAALRGKYAVVTHPDETTAGYLVGDIVSEAGQTVIVFAEHDPGFEIRPDGTSKMNYYPAKSWTGTHTFKIDHVDVYDTNPLQAVTLNASDKDLLTGERTSLSVQALRRDGSVLTSDKAKTTYSSSDETVVKVDPEGNAEAVGEGTAVITAAVDWNGATKTSSLLLTSQKRAYRMSDFVNLPIVQQSASTQYVSGSNTLQFEANQAGESIAFEFEAGEAAAYDIGIKPFSAASYGNYQIYLDGASLASYDFYSASPGASAVFRPLGTVTLAPGNHTLSFVNIGKNASSTNYKFGVSQLEIKESLKEPPILSQQAGNIYVQEPATIGFADNPAWRGQIVSVTVNGVPLSSGQFTIASGNVTLAPGALGGAGAKRIVIRASGYRHAITELAVLPFSALSALGAAPGPLVPSFDPGVFDYAVSVSNSVYTMNVTASTYRPDSVMSVSGQVYTA
ncbi:MAG: Heparinase II/III-like protein, partial [Paenibacillus sp.]|nr:Heparinase II/III-like protein [Paenibacillus sp.]